MPPWSLQVSGEGDVLYVFPKDYRSRLGAKSFRIKAEPFFEKAKVLSSLLTLVLMMFYHFTVVVVWLSL